MQLVDAFGLAVERWIETRVRGGALEPHLLDLREALPGLYEELKVSLFSPPVETDCPEAAAAAE